MEGADPPRDVLTVVFVEALDGRRAPSLQHTGLRRPGPSHSMNSKNLARRLERLESELAPGDERVLVINVKRIGDKQHPGIKTIELRGLEPQGRRRRWPRSGGR